MASWLRRPVEVLLVGICTLAAATSAAADFTDADLQALLQRRGAGLIYAVSEHMPLSVKGLKDIEGAAAALHVDLQVVVDPDSDLAAITAAAGAVGIDGRRCARLASSELLRKNMTIHYPSVLLYSDGRFLGHLLPGYLGKTDYEAFIRKALASGTG